jgi:hypothetical protein
MIVILYDNNKNKNIKICQCSSYNTITVTFFIFSQKYNNDTCQYIASPK